MVIEKNDEMSECGIKIDSEKIEQMKDQKYLGSGMLWIGNFTYGYRNDYYTGYFIIIPITSVTDISYF